MSTEMRGGQHYASSDSVEDKATRSPIPSPEALAYLRKLTGNSSSEFRADQWAIIDSLVNRREKVLLIQRTGWGKSAVYFISAKLLRDCGRGPTLIVSPLLSLIRNQVMTGRRLGLCIEAFHSGTKADFSTFENLVVSNKLDVLLTTPEQFANTKFLDELLPHMAQDLGLLVVDEAHCISDWGHDFRPDYRRISNIVRQFPGNTALLATTATANSRVVTDITSQLGNVRLLRGPLLRENLALQNLGRMSVADRLAWLAMAISRLVGKGIVYTQTQRDAEHVAAWLRKRKIAAHAYHSTITTKEHSVADDARRAIEADFEGGELRILVATSALGMGYDNPHVRFVIHYQMPNSIISYYQQVGRAGRGHDAARGFLMSGPEDMRLQSFFRTSSLPTAHEVRVVLDAVERLEGATVERLTTHSNLSYGRIEKTMKFLSVENPSPIVSLGKSWQRTPIPWNTENTERQDKLVSVRQTEWNDMGVYLAHTGCLMSFLLEALDDVASPRKCGRCSNCTGTDLIPVEIDQVIRREATEFVQQSSSSVIKPRQRIVGSPFKEYAFRGTIPVIQRAENGRTLGRWGDGRLGDKAAKEKRAGQFSDDLVRASADYISTHWHPSPRPTWIACVPSLRCPELVLNFAQKIADQLGLPFADVVLKVRKTSEQKSQQNSFYQCKNLDGAFRISTVPFTGPVLLVDDMVDSGWMFTVVAMLLRQAGSGPVFPFALASSSTKDS